MSAPEGSDNSEWIEQSAKAYCSVLHRLFGIMGRLLRCFFSELKFVKCQKLFNSMIKSLRSPVKITPYDGTSWPTEKCSAPRTILRWPLPLPQLVVVLHWLFENALSFRHLDFTQLNTFHAQFVGHFFFFVLTPPPSNFNFFFSKFDQSPQFRLCGRCAFVSG